MLYKFHHTYKNNKCFWRWINIPCCWYSWRDVFHCYCSNVDDCSQLNYNISSWTPECPTFAWLYWCLKINTTNTKECESFLFMSFTIPRFCMYKILWKLFFATGFESLIYCSKLCWDFKSVEIFTLTWIIFRGWLVSIWNKLIPQTVTQIFCS